MRFRFEMFWVLLCCGAAHALEPGQVLDKVAPSLVLVRAVDEREGVIRSGGGIVIGRGQVVTNCRVLAKAKGVQLRHQDIIFPATLAHADVERDLCQVSAPRLAAPAVVLSGVQAIRLGQRVFTVGATAAAAPALSEGVVSGLRDYRGMPIIQTSAKVSEGAGITGVFDSDGKLIGLSTILVRDQPGNYAIAADAIGEIPKRAQEAREKQAAAAAAAAAGATAPRAKPFVAEWTARIALLEKSQDEATLSRSLGILLDISAIEDVELLQKHEKTVSSREWHNAYAMGVDGEGRFIWGGGYRLRNRPDAEQTALEQCSAGGDSSCKVVMTNGDFQKETLVEIAKQLGARNVDDTRRELLQSAQIPPRETRVGIAAVAGGGTADFNYSYGYSSARD